MPILQKTMNSNILSKHQNKIASFFRIISKPLFYISFIPFFYPLVIPVSLIFSFIIFFILYFNQTSYSDENRSILTLSLRKMIQALLINLSFFLILFLHSWFCYTRSLYREVEPFRDMILQNQI